MIPFLVILTIVVIYQVTRPPSEPAQVAQTPAATAGASRPAAADDRGCGSQRASAACPAPR